MFGCAAVVNVPLMVFILANPVTVIFVNVDNPVIPATVPGDKVPLNVPPTGVAVKETGVDPLQTLSSKSKEIVGAGTTSIVFEYSVVQPKEELGSV